MQTDVAYLTILTPPEFNFEECLVFLNRSNQENLHEIQNGKITKLLNYHEELILFTIINVNRSLCIEFMNGSPSVEGKKAVISYIIEWFDLETDLIPFYQMAAGDPVLGDIVKKYYGLRILCIPDLFEALAWAVIGQQINLAFAYTLKKRFVEKFGESLTIDGNTYWAFPSCRKIAGIQASDLRKLQFTSKKAEYIISIASNMANGVLLKENLLQETDGQKVEKSLTAIWGIGQWSANYVMMKCLHFPSAFPIADVGLHNALKKQLGLKQKPAIGEIETLAKNWEGWQAYATFYLWRALYE